MTAAPPKASARLLSLISRTKAFAAALLGRYEKPVFLWSGGKDSTVLLHLLQGVVPDIPIIQYRDPWFPERWVWMQQLAAKWQLEIFDYPATKLTLYSQGDGLAAVSHYHQGHDQYIKMPRDIIEWEPGRTAEHKKWLCGREDFLGRPTGTMAFPWHLIINGHKEGDLDPLLGNVRLLESIVEHKDELAHLPDYAFPLRFWTDADIWDYIEAYEVPMQSERYDLETRESREDKRLNSDYLPMCVQCIDCRKTPGETVPCLKYGEATNVGDLAPYEDSLESEYFTASNPKI